MSTNVVNLDALIPREDLAVDSGVPNVARLEKIDIRHIEEGFFLSALRKPDFQRETAQWSSEKVADLVRAFVDGDLIPAVILWQSGKDVFVIDGAHRMSALIAWVHNDYGDGAVSKNFFDGRIPEEQRQIAERTLKAASKNLANVNEKTTERVGRLATNSLIAQWVPAGDAKAAEDSFFKINQAATPIDPTETRILRSRNSANAMAARAIVRAGTGHKYWGGYATNVQGQIESLGKEINAALYEPPLGNLPIKTLDVPVAGRGYNALPFVFDFVNQANGLRILNYTKKKAVQQKLPDDQDGSHTVTYMKKVRDAVNRITTTYAGSLGVHPVVYFYTRGGSFLPSAFIGTAQLLTELSEQKKLAEFTHVRRSLEDFILAHKEYLTRISEKFGGGNRSVEWFYKLYRRLFDDFSTGKTSTEIVADFSGDPEFAFITVASPRTRAAEKSKFSRGVKTAAFFEEALPGGVRCSLCGALVHKNSMHFDHKERRRDGGSNDLTNAAVAHPYCNSTLKN